MNVIKGGITISCQSDSTIASFLPVFSILTLGLQSKHHVKMIENRFHLTSFLCDEETPQEQMFSRVGLVSNPTYHLSTDPLAYDSYLVFLVKTKMTQSFGFSDLVLTKRNCTLYVQPGFLSAHIIFQEQIGLLTQTIILTLSDNRKTHLSSGFLDAQACFTGWKLFIQKETLDLVLA